MKSQRIGGIVLCAGFGTRLQPITHEIPKPAIPFLGKPMVWYAVRALYRAGIRRIAANLCHLPDTMEQCLRQVCAEIGTDEPVCYREGTTIAGTAGGAAACAKLLPDCDQFVIYHGDVLSGADLSIALDEHRRSQCDVSLVVAPRPENSSDSSKRANDKSYESAIGAFQTIKSIPMPRTKRVVLRAFTSSNDKSSIPSIRTVTLASSPKSTHK